MIDNYKDAEKFLNKLRNKDEMLFRMAISHLMDVGIRNLTEENVTYTCAEIRKQDDSHSFMTIESEEWENVKSELENFFEDEEILVIGTVGRWNGNYSAGKVISYDELHKCWSDCDYLEIYDEDGHMHINASHHDGNNHFEVKILTEKGRDYYSRWNENWNDSRSEQEIHTKLAESSRYTHIPHFAREVYGCKTR